LHASGPLFGGGEKGLTTPETFKVQNPKISMSGNKEIVGFQKVLFSLEPKYLKCTTYLQPPPPSSEYLMLHPN
jgi:hypothetical protein